MCLCLTTAMWSPVPGHTLSPFLYRESLFCNVLVIEKFNFTVSCCSGVFTLQLTLISFNFYCCSLDYTKRRCLISVLYFCLYFLMYIITYLSVLKAVEGLHVLSEANDEGCYRAGVVSGWCQKFCFLCTICIFFISVSFSLKKRKGNMLKLLSSHAHLTDLDLN